MPLHGKIVVVKRSGGDGTEFPLTATCLFGRKPDCDIRIQLPQVSKEHCRIDLNENKEIILTNLSSVNPTRVNGEVLQQSERLKHGDVITIIDRSFRFEYPPAPTPKKRSSTGGKADTLKVLHDQQVGDTVTSETGDKRISEVSTDPHLKDGTNHDNIQRSLEKTLEVEPKEEGKTASPFNDLYQMIKKSLDVKTPRKSSASLLQTPTSRFCTPKPASVRKNDEPVTCTEDKSIPQKNEAKVCLGADETKGAENTSGGTPKSVKKQRRSSQGPSTEMAAPEVETAEKSEATSPQKRIRTPPQRYTACEVIEQVTAQSPKSPLRRRSNEAKPAVTQEQEAQAVTSPKTKRSPRNSGCSSAEVGKVKETSKKRKSGELAADLPTPQIKKKRVSFGGFLCPELFDKRLPPDSPLRKGASPRRSFCVFKPKQSLLRRASVTGSLQFDEEQPGSPKVQSPAKMRTPSPKKSNAKNASPKTPTPGKKSPKSRSPSPKATSPGQKSPKSKSPSPKATSPGLKSPKSRSPSPKATSSAKKSPKPRTPSPKAASPAEKTPKSKSPSTARGRSPTVGGTPGVQTPRVQGRFSVSRISTPSPNAEDAVTDQVPSVTVTPKMPQRRKSISQETSSAAKVMRRRSGISRASLKAKNSWANIVKFGQPKAQVVAPAKKAVAKMTKKKTVPKPQTPARKIQGHFSTGHADSPVTIVVGRAHKQRVVHATGAAPRLVTNTALLKRNMKMDEDLTGISEMFKTPVNERKRRSVINEDNATKTPVGALGTSVVEPSVLNTPEEPGEMMVSPLSVASAVKDRKYNSEAVQRLLNDDQESSFVSDVPALEIHSDDSGEQQCTDMKTTSQTTPKQKPELPECLTGVKRIMKTPRQKAEPVEDLRGRLLKTPKQKPEQQECLTGVKRIMKTPRQKAEPVEDLRGGLLKTPKQKPEQQECLTGVKRIMRTPRQKAEPVEDLRGRLLKTPKQKPEQQECLTGVKRIMKTPRQKAEPIEDLRGKVLKTPKQKLEQQECLTGVKRMMETPKREAEPVEDIRVELLTTPKQEAEQQECLTGVESILNTPQQRAESHEDLQEKPVETPKALEAADVSLDDEKELMETPDQVQESAPQTEATGQLETNEQVEDQTPLDCEEGAAKELDFAHEEPRGDIPSDVIALHDDIEKEEDAKEVVVDDHVEEVPSGHNNNESSDASEPLSEPAVDEISAEQPKVDTVDETLPEDKPEVDAVDESSPVEQAEVDAVDESSPVEQAEVDAVDESSPVEQAEVDAVDESSPVEEPEVETAPGKVTEMDTTATDPDPKKKPVRGRRAKTVEPKAPEDAVVSAPVRGRRGKKAEATEPPAIETAPQAPVTESLPEEETCKVTETDAAIVENKSVRGRRAKLVESKPADDNQEAAEHSEEPVAPTPVKGRRGKKTEAAAGPPAVRQTTRGRNAKSQESNDDEVTKEKSASLPSKPTLKTRRGRKASDDQVETVQEVAAETEMVPEPKSEQSPPVEVNIEANDSASPQEKAVKPKRGRKAKQPEEPVLEQQDLPITQSEDAPEMDTAKEANANEVCSDQLEVVPSASDENKLSDAMETVPQTPVTESLPEVETATCKVTEMDAAVVQKKTVRGRRAKLVESKSAEDKQEAAEHSEDPVVSAPVRGRRGKKTEAAAPAAVRRTTKGRNAKSQEIISEDKPEVDAVVENSPVEQSDVDAVDENSSEEQPKVETATVEVTEIDTTATDPDPKKKSVRGRRAKTVEPEAAEDKQEAEDAVVAAPVRGRRGKKAEAAAPPAVRQTGRGRNAKSQESTSDDKPEMVPETAAEITPVTEISIEVVSDQSDPAPSVEEAVVKPVRGRKTKQTPVEPSQPEPEKTEAVSDEPVVIDAQSEKSIPTVAKPKRGRKTKPDTVEQNEVAEDTVVAVETKQQSEPPVKAKRGRNAKKEEVETTESQEPAKKVRRTKKAEQDHVEPQEEVQTVENVVPEEAEATLVAEPVKVDEQATVAAKPRKGGRKAKQDTESETPVEPTEVPAVKRGRRGKQVAEEVAVTAVVPEEKPEHEVEAEEKKDAEPDSPVIKQSRGRGAKTSSKNEASQAIPAKRARRGAALPVEETNAEVSEPTSTSVEPAKRGRRAAAKPTADDATEESSSAVVEDTKTSKRSVKWNADVEVFDIPKATPVKAARGRKSKLDTESKNVSKDDDKAEEKDLSDKVIEAQPVKRARRGAKVADVTAEESTSKVKSVEAETQPKTRRGRPAKK
ncbi:proliferation marker protein Ki-67 isoform X1 [Epinephelus fuscoguttatus]|uniref:proliferation marker protein Ki-67 isoform X1 n=1 Tax=Epinephelus fuscoguttatus TaxID=293821 RepID=UPI0020D128AA|nr:proliferation marker protein Ki-67 isoform X1 [Epinephelus fuscoguttatus]